MKDRFNILSFLRDSLFLTTSVYFNSFQTKTLDLMLILANSGGQDAFGVDKLFDTFE